MKFKEYLNNLTIDEIEELFKDNILNVSDIIDEIRKENKKQKEKEKYYKNTDNII